MAQWEYLTAVVIHPLGRIRQFSAELCQSVAPGPPRRPAALPEQEFQDMARRSRATASSVWVLTSNADCPVRRLVASGPCQPS